MSANMIRTSDVFKMKRQFIAFMSWNASRLSRGIYKRRRTLHRKAGIREQPNTCFFFTELSKGSCHLPVTDDAALFSIGIFLRCWEQSENKDSSENKRNKSYRINHCRRGGGGSRCGHRRPTTTKHTVIQTRELIHLCMRQSLGYACKRKECNTKQRRIQNVEVSEMWPQLQE